MFRTLQRLRDAHRASRALQASDQAVPHAGRDAGVASRTRARGQSDKLLRVSGHKQVSQIDGTDAVGESSQIDDVDAVGTPAEPMTANGREGDDAEAEGLRATGGRTRQAAGSQPAGERFNDWETCEFRGGVYRPLRSDGPWMSLSVSDSDSESGESQQSLRADDYEYDDDSDSLFTEDAVATCPSFGELDDIAF
eukprot:TRINITY_DN89266_c0_g1_i1.p1 TRINITY_DN89266_c0_g1~~TRINITY_DN89266_c0_g1_i1.p1  ORF type:complete len:195 (-),score=37.84 TRINITY_DN89266_c0_g1_i1:28-612(-)